jgi:hypothetical protein
MGANERGNGDGGGSGCDGVRSWLDAYRGHPISPWIYHDESQGITPEQLDAIFTEPTYMDPRITRQSGKTMNNMYNAFMEMQARCGYVKRPGYVPAYDERDVHLLAFELAIHGGK